MKKLLFTLCMGAAIFPAAAYNLITGAPATDVKTLPATRASDDQLIYGYCQGYNTCLGIGQAGISLEAAIEIPESVIKSWVGAKITAINIGFGQSSNTRIFVYITDDIEGYTLYDQYYNVTVQNGWNQVVLDQPFEITESTPALYIGYQQATYGASDAPIGVDLVETNCPYGDIILIQNQPAHIGDMYGSVCIQAIVEGDNLPESDLMATSILAQPFATIGKPFDADCTVINMGAGIISDFTVTCSLNGKEVGSQTISLADDPLYSGDAKNFTFEGIVADQAGVDLPLTLTITSVNGGEDTNPLNNTLSTTISVAEKLFPRTVVVEEFTGIWCSWCVRGIVGMEYMKENYPDDFIGIAVHSNGTGYDPMEVNSYLPIINRYAGNYPSAIADRMRTFDPDVTTLEAMYNIEKSYDAAAGVSLTATYSEEDDVINVKADAEFSVSDDKSPYLLSFVIIENNFGPYNQQNAYAGGRYGEMGGWEKKASRVETYFNEVARDITTAWGIDGSLPSSVESGKVYSYSTELSTKNVVNINECEVIVLLLDTETSEIVNAAKVSMAGSGVEGIEAGSIVSVRAGHGAIYVSGDYKDCKVYGIDGTIAASGNGSDTINVAPGMYVVKVTGLNNNVITKKVMVK